MSGAAASRKGPLTGVRVVEFQAIGPVPFTGMLLSDLGADVVRIDRAETVGRKPGTPDTLGRNRRSIGLDLKSDEGREIALRLVETADVLLEGYRPGVMERLGLGPDECLSRRPSLVYGRMTGWGQQGPMVAKAGHDLNYIGLTGALAAIGRAGGPPQIPLALVGDFGGGAMQLAFGVLAGVIAARADGIGQVVDTAIVDGVALMMTAPMSRYSNGDWNLERGTNLADSGRPFYDVYECADGRYISVAAIEPAFYANLLAALKLDDFRPEDQYKPAEWSRLRERLTELFRSRTRDEWMQVLTQDDICVAPVLDMAEAQLHEHLVQRGTYVTVDGMVQGAPAPRFSRTPGSVQRRAPKAGEHTTEILRELDLSDGDIESILSRGAVR